MDKLGLEVRTDALVSEKFRWLTVGSKFQPTFEIALMLPSCNPIANPAQIETLIALVQAGVISGGLLEVDDCHATHKDLASKGVIFAKEPHEQFFGTEATMIDPFGNRFSIIERKGKGRM